jgi:hypothetical protein
VEISGDTVITCTYVSCIEVVNKSIHQSETQLIITTFCVWKFVSQRQETMQIGAASEQGIVSRGPDAGIHLICGRKLDIAQNLVVHDEY